MGITRPIDEKQQQDIANITTRRNVVSAGICTLACSVGVALAASAGRFLLGTPEAKDDAWSDAGDVSQLEVGAPQELTFVRSRTDGWKAGNERASAWVILDNSKQVTAFSPACTHLGCAYRWEARRNVFSCPCHGSVFNIEGQVVRGPATRPLDRYAVRIEGDRLWLGPVERAETT